MRATLIVGGAATAATLLWLHRRRRTAAPVTESELVAVLDRARALELLTERAEDTLWNGLDDGEATVRYLVAQWTVLVDAAEGGLPHAAPASSAVETAPAPGHASDLDEALRAAHEESISRKHPIHAALCAGQAYASSWLQLRMRSPANWETLEKRRAVT